MSVPTFPIPGTSGNPRVTQGPTAPHAVRRGRFAVDVHRHRLLDLQHSDDLPQQRGVAGGRYHCPACRGPLAFSSRRTCAQFTPRFSHRHIPGRHRCPAPALHLQAIRAGQNLSTALRDRLAAAHPHLLHHLEPGDLAYPPTLVLRSGTRTTVVHPLLTTPSQDAARARVQDCFRRHGAKTAQLWLLPWQPPDTATPAPAGSAVDNVQAGEVVMVPSPMHRTVCLQGATVGFLDDDYLWLPRTAAGPAGTRLAEAPRWNLVRMPLTDLTVHGVLFLGPSRPATAVGIAGSGEREHPAGDIVALPVPATQASALAVAPDTSRARQELRRIASRARYLASQLVGPGVRGWRQWRLHLSQR